MAEKRIRNRTKVVTDQNFYDVFGDWPAAEQANVLRVLEQINRQTVRAEQRRGKIQKEQGPVKTAPVYPCGFCQANDAASHSETCPNRPATCAKCGNRHDAESCLKVPA